MKSNLFYDKKADLYKDGNFFNYFFLDITKEEWDNLRADDYVLLHNFPIDSETIKTLQIDKIAKYNGIWFFVRFKDVYREKVSQEARELVQKTIDKQIKELKENPPEWASMYKDEYNGIVSKHVFMQEKADLGN